MTPDRHRGSITSDFVGLEQARCSCGWAGPERITIEEAEADLEAHYEAAADES